MKKFKLLKLNTIYVMLFNLILILVYALICKIELVDYILTSFYKSVFSFCIDDWASYYDVFIAIVVTIFITLLSIAITMYTFLKSALDKTLEENEFASSVVVIYLDRSANKLRHISAYVSLIIIFAMGIYSFLKHGILKEINIIAGLFIILVFNIIINLIYIFDFWKKCVENRTVMLEIIDEQMKCCMSYIDNLMKTVIKPEEMEWLIGYWSKWDTNEIDKIVASHNGRFEWKYFDKKELSDLEEEAEDCIKITADQYINLFGRLEQFMLSGAQLDNVHNIQENEIITVIQERINILNPTIGADNDPKKGVEVEDIGELKYKAYGNDISPVKILVGVKEFRRHVGFPSITSDSDISSNKRKSFFVETENLYKKLRLYRNLLISKRVLKYDHDNDNKETKDNKTNKESKDDNVYEDANVVKALYYYMLRIYAVFLNSISIKGVSFNGSTLNFANFYNSTLEDVSFYSSEFYHTIFSRTKIYDGILDLSKFNSICFYNTRINDSSLNNSIFEYVKFDNTQMNETAVNICEFKKCELKDSEMTNSSFNGSTFNACEIDNVDFSGSVMEDIQLSNTPIKDCRFNSSSISNWICTISGDIFYELRGCDFSDSQWNIEKLYRADMTDSVFRNAVMVNASFDKCMLGGAVFEAAVLTESRFSNCEDNENPNDEIGISNASFRKANLFKAEFNKCMIDNSDFYKAEAECTKFNHCSIRSADCGDATFKAAILHYVNFGKARLYGATLENSDINKCVFDEMLADRARFTDICCKDSSFNYASMSETNLSGAEFYQCIFKGSDLSDAIMNKTRFLNGCEFKNVDFSGNRFVETVFENVTFDNCDFTNSKLINIRLKNVFFKNCDFYGVKEEDIRYEHIVKIEGDEKNIY